MSMSGRLRLALYPVLLIALVWPAALANPSAGKAQRSLRAERAKTTADSALFVENVGQFDSRVAYSAPGAGGALFLTRDSVWVSALEQPKAETPSPTDGEQPQRGVALRLTLPGADLSRPEPLYPAGTSVNYLLGKDSSAWKTDVPAWGAVVYRGAYPGYDLEVSGGGSAGWQWRLLPLLREAPGLDTGALPELALQVDGAGSLTVAGDKLLAATGIGTVALPLLAGSGATPLVNGQTVTAPYATPRDASEGVESQAVEDLIYYRTLGVGTVSSEDDPIAVDAAGSVYVTGYTNSSDFPTTTGAYDTELSGSNDAFVTKLNSTGTALVYSTFLGGTSNDRGNGIALDSAGNAYITGYTQSSGFPTTSGAYDTSFNHSTSYEDDAFVTKLNSTGTALVYSTFLGSTSTDLAYGITVDSAGNAYTTGSTNSSGFPTTAGALDTELNGSYDAFVTKLNSAGTDAVYSTFLGGTSSDYAYGVTVDSAGNAFITGSTNSSGFPTTAGAYDTQPNGGAAGFVTRLNAAGTALLYSTFLGSSSSDHAYGIAATDAGRAYVVGEDPAGLFVASLQCGAAAGEPIPSGFLDFPVAYDTFSVSALGFPQSGRVTAWFDHSASADTMKTWRGIPISESAGVSVDVLDCGTGSDRCYDGHTGTDISAATTEVRAAAAGTAYGVYRTCGTNEQGCNDGWGNTVRIDHGNGYATLYAHLAQVDAAVVDGAPVTNQQRLGTMGETGNAFGAHLHFGVYAKVAGNWVAVDPYGLRSTLGLTGYLWRESLSANATVTTAGASGQSPSGQAAFNAPAGSVTEPITFELWDAPVAAPSAQLNPSIQQRSTGHSFWMRVLEWLGLQSLESAGPSLQAQSGLFATPVTISVRFGPRDIRHLDMSQLSLYRWDETSSVWIRLPTTVDAGAGLASAQTDRPGEFDLQAPLLCAADAREPDDTFYNAEALSAPGSSTRLLDIADDEDWVVFSAVAGQRYIIQTSGLGPGLETVVEVYDSSGLTLLAADDNGGGAGASRLSWTPTRSDDYFVRVVPAAGSSVGCSGTYTLSLAKAADATPTPTTTTPSPTPSATPQVAPTGTPPAPGGTTVYLPLTLRTE